MTDKQDAKSSGALVFLRGPNYGGIPRVPSNNHYEVSSQWNYGISQDIAEITGKVPVVATPKNIWRAANTWCSRFAQLPKGMTIRVVRTDEYIGDMYIDFIRQEDSDKGYSKSVAGRVVLMSTSQWKNHDGSLPNGQNTKYTFLKVGASEHWQDGAVIVAKHAAPGCENKVSHLVTLLHGQIEQIMDAYDPVAVRSCIESFVSRCFGTKLGAGGVYFIPANHEDKCKRLHELFEHVEGPNWSFGFENIGQYSHKYWAEMIMESLEKGFDEVSNLKTDKKGNRADKAIGKLCDWKEQLLTAQHLVKSLPGAVDKLEAMFKGKLAELQNLPLEAPDKVDAILSQPVIDIVTTPPEEVTEDPELEEIVIVRDVPQLEVVPDPKPEPQVKEPSLHDPLNILDF